MDVVFWLEMIGTVAFAVSGACVAIRKHMDVLGVAILGMTTAIGGGVVRDLILDVVPPVAFRKPVYALVAVAVSLIVFLPACRRVVAHEQSKLLILADTIGLSVFTVVGVQSGIGCCGGFFLSVFVGVITAVGGGVLRDIFAGMEPTIFVRYFYACASLVGAVLTALLWPMNATVAMLAGAAAVFTLRLLAVRFNWNLPRA